MKSKITIEIDFENGNLPVLQILQADSEDVRDKLVRQFLQSFQHSSRWCKITYLGSHSASIGRLEDILYETHKWTISPITPIEIPNEMKLMDAVLG